MSPRRYLLVASLALVLHAVAYVLWTEDDAGISLRYAVHLAEGDGLVYNVGERVEAISNLGYTLLLAAAHFVPAGDDALINLLVIAKLLGLVAALLGLREAGRLARVAGLGPGTTGAALCLIASSTPYAAWAVGALETPFVAWLATMLIAGAAEIAQINNSSDDASGSAATLRAGFAGAGLVMFRVDGFVIPVIVIIALAIGRVPWRTLLRVLAPPLVMLMVLFGFRQLYYGHWFPTPVSAKVDIGASIARIGDTLSHYTRPFSLLFGGWPVVASALALGLLHRSPGRGARRITALSILGVTAYTLVVGRDWMPLFRFMVPVLPAVVILVVHLISTVAERLRLSPSRALLATVVAGAMAATSLLGHQSFRTRRASPIWYLHPTVQPSSLVRFWLPAVAWLQAHVDPTSTLITSEAGFIPYLSKLRTVDSYGLATPAIGELPHGEVTRSTLGVHTAFIEAEPVDPAQRFLADYPGSAVVLQIPMLESWNDGRTPESLFGDRWRLTGDSPVGDRWAVYIPVSSGLNPPGSARESAADR